MLYTNQFYITKEENKWKIFFTYQSVITETYETKLSNKWFVKSKAETVQDTAKTAIEAALEYLKTHNIKRCDEIPKIAEVMNFAIIYCSDDENVEIPEELFEIIQENGWDYYEEAIDFMED